MAKINELPIYTGDLSDLALSRGVVALTSTGETRKITWKRLLEEVRTRVAEPR